MQTPYAFGGCSDKTCQVRRTQRIAITNVSLAPHLTGLKVALTIVGANASTTERNALQCYTLTGRSMERPCVVVQCYSLNGRSMERPCVEIPWSSMLFTQEAKAVVHGALQRYALKGVQLDAPTLWPNIIR
jgi:hypothetical protein